MTWTLVGGSALLALLGIFLAWQAVAYISRPNQGNTDFPSAMPTLREMPVDDPVGGVPLQWHTYRGKKFSVMMPGEVTEAPFSNLWSVNTKKNGAGLACTATAAPLPGRGPLTGDALGKTLLTDLATVSGYYDGVKPVTICGYEGVEGRFKAGLDGVAGEGVIRCFETPTHTYTFLFVANHQQFKESEARQFLDSFKIEDAK